MRSSTESAYAILRGRVLFLLSPLSLYFGAPYGYALRARVNHRYTVVLCMPSAVATATTEPVSLNFLIIVLGSILICAVSHMW